MTNQQLRTYIDAQIRTERDVLLRATVEYVRGLVDPLAKRIEAIEAGLKSPFGPETDKRLEAATRRLTKGEHQARADRLAYSSRKAARDKAARVRKAKARNLNEAEARRRARAKGKQPVPVVRAATKRKPRAA